MAANLHIEAMAWLRYVKQMPLVCTEVGGWNADVLGIGPRYCIEVEVKKSISDLRADFRNKKQKHWYYARGEATGWRTHGVPNYLYFIVPETLREQALRALEAQEASNLVGERQNTASSYGLLWVPTLSFGAETKSTGYTAGKNIQVGRKAKKLHANPPSSTLVSAATRRLSSELVGLYQSHEELEQSLMKTLEDIRANIRAAAAATAAFTPEPPEDPDEPEQSHPNPTEPDADPVPPELHE